MSKLNTLFRQRIGFPANDPLSFESLNSILEKTAKAIPFENLRIIEHRTSDICAEQLIDDMLIKEQGGLCYELNSLLQLFLIENGFDAVLTRGIVFNKTMREYAPFGRTHAAILLTHENKTYVVDTGFGGNLPLTPVPLTGETVSSSNGQFRIRQEDSEHGDFVLEMKLKYKDTDWNTGYAFDSRKPIADLSECSEIQNIIAAHEQSPFNKHPLLTKRTDAGNMTLTNRSFTQWNHGIVTKESIDEARYEELLRQHFGMQINPRE
ncbi:arylamine N-acetyltransferase [Paenibacillus allorhizosphaerae]|uniref:Arylamine N-acetyltransferase / N-hydroxyarylamine O-acetyltransferase n=1 Tax=Paenibacillus allorhizosphaerae TaxID=2849866 RepID=A0ABM8VQX1_9BACL|nr:arylamine N-acetyltransferase [Paenibacillus allorhizosphaerae]CAG7654731.1 Arylamine N-acetyltransferase / N-hydroxyarylamine O-acetyltransferase [Paenibacillus allorhizosphaerae]